MSVQKLLSLVCCTLLGFVCGTLYLFSAYGPQLATQLQYSGKESSLLAFSGTIGIVITGVPVAVLIEVKGLTVAVLIGALCVSCGYIGLKDQYDKLYLSVPLSSTLMFLVGWGSTSINSAIIKCCALIFPNNRGIATSFPIASYGLSAFVYSLLGSRFFKNNTSGFLGFLGYSTLIVSFAALPFVWMADRDSNRGHTTRSLAPVRSASPIPLTEIGSHSNTAVFSKNRPLIEDLIHKSVQNNVMTRWDILKSSNYWKLSTIIGVLVALGQLYIYTVGFMVTALVESEDLDSGVEQQLQVSILSIANCFGRLLCGFLGDIIANKLHKSRTWVLIIPAVTLLVVQILGWTVTSEKELWKLSVLNGIGYGFTWSSTPQILIEFFGVHNFSFVWGVIGLSPIIPSYLFTYLFGANYDSNLTLEDNNNLKVCLKGHLCYNYTFGWTIVAVSLIFVLVLWTILKPNVSALKARYLGSNR